MRYQNLHNPTAATPFLAMREVGTYSFTNHSLSAFMRGCADPSKRYSPVHPHNSQVSEESDPNQGSDGSSTQHNESFRPTSEGASPTRPGDKPGRPLFKCPHCPNREPYAQKQGLVRHLREKHEPSFGCSHPGGCNYEWAGSRRYEYRNHLKKKHELEDKEIEDILSQLPRRRRGDSAVESDQVAGHSESGITTTEHEDSSGLGHLAATLAPSSLFSKEDITLLRGYYEIHGRFRFPSVHPGGPIPPNPGMLHIPVLRSPVGEYHSNSHQPRP